MARRDPLWRVRLSFVGTTLETATGPAGGGEIRLTVRAEDASGARRAALVQAKAVVADLDPEAVPFWSTDEIVSAPRMRPQRLALFDEDSKTLPAFLAELLASLADEDLWIAIGSSHFTVYAEADDRFDVGVQVEEGAAIVYAAAWHGHFQDLDQAAACFNWLLTPFYRVAYEQQDDRGSAAWIERYEADGWAPMHPILFRNPTDPTQWMGGNWQREYRQQLAQSPSIPYTDVVPEAVLDERGFPKGTLLGARRGSFDKSMAQIEEWLDREATFDPGNLEPPLGLE